jgi:hypothetical protein
MFFVRSNKILCFVSVFYLGQKANSLRTSLKIQIKISLQNIWKENDEVGSVLSFGFLWPTVQRPGVSVQPNPAVHRGLWSEV